MYILCLDWNNKRLSNFDTFSTLDDQNSDEVKEFGSGYRTWGCMLPDSLVTVMWSSVMDNSVIVQKLTDGYCVVVCC